MPGLETIKIPKIRLAEAAYQQIIGAIANGHIPVDKKIVQEKLASELGISRTPLREALFRLEQEGILSTSSRGGFWIKKISAEEVRDIYQTRIAIEGHAAYIIAESGDHDAIQTIRSVIDAQCNLDPQGASQLYDANRKIHRAFVECTQNHYLLNMFDTMWNCALSLHMFSSIEFELVFENLRDHHLLCDVLESGTPDEAFAAMRHHINSGLELQLRGHPLSE